MSKKKPSILVVDDDHSLSEILVNILDYAGYESEVAFSGREALEKLGAEAFDLLLLDLKLPDMSGMKILETAMKMKGSPQVVMISGQGTIQIAVEATKLGAHDFLEKPLDAERVLVTIKNAIEKGRLEREKARLLESVQSKYLMVGQSDSMKRIRQMVAKAAETTSKVLIEGENGTGKELVARAIHNQSARAGEHFITVNCAAIPETLIESELFGYKKGAFTGAVRDKMGRFQAADSGTLFLDEIGDMSLMTQAKVLRVLETGVVERVGGNESIQTDVRVIAATNKDLGKEIGKGRFREDLYFRLNVLNIQVPPLRERKEDMPLLIEHFMNQYCQEYGVPKKEFKLSTIERLMAYPWPGNIRELKNVVEKIMVLIEGMEVEPRDVTLILRQDAGCKPSAAFKTLRESREEFEKAYLSEALANADWNITHAARTLGITRTYLHKLLNKYGISGSLPAASFSTSPGREKSGP